MSAVFHINNKKTNNQVKFDYNKKILPFFLRNQIPRSNIGHENQVSRTIQITLQNVDITRRTVDASCWFWLRYWCKTLSTATLTLIQPTVEYCVPALCHSHTHLIDPAINTVFANCN